MIPNGKSIWPKRWSKLCDVIFGRPLGNVSLLKDVTACETKSIKVNIQILETSERQTF